MGEYAKEALKQIRKWRENPPTKRVPSYSEECRRLLDQENRQVDIFSEPTENLAPAARQTAPANTEGRSTPITRESSMESEKFILPVNPALAEKIMKPTPEEQEQVMMVAARILKNRDDGLLRGRHSENSQTPTSLPPTGSPSKKESGN